MHEMGIMASVLEQTLQYAQENQATTVRKINLEIGEYSRIVPDMAQKFFSYIAKGTVAENAAIEITVVPLMLCCAGCGHKERLSRELIEEGCPVCGECNLFPTSSGRGWRMESIELR